jgi:HD superfamily phosphodiesterase
MGNESNQMKHTGLTTLTEKYVKNMMSQPAGLLSVAHGFKHVDRVRNRALLIATEEGFQDLEAVELAALLHDIGLTQIDNPNKRSRHGDIGSLVASEFLKQHSKFDTERIEWISDAIRYHNVLPEERAKHLESLKEKEILTKILCDADMLDSLGAIGLMRACASKNYLAEYDSSNIKGKSWGLSYEEFSTTIGGIGNSNKTIIDQINQQVRYYDSLYTETARKIGLPLTNYLKGFVLQLEKEIVN